MSLLKHLEENAEHLLSLVKHMVQVQLSMHGTVSEETQKIFEALDAHVNPPAPEVDPEPTPAPAPAPVAVVDAPAPDPVVDAPAPEETNSVAQDQASSNVAN